MTPQQGQANGKARGQGQRTEDGGQRTGQDRRQRTGKWTRDSAQWTEDRGQGRVMDDGAERTGDSEDQGQPCAQDRTHDMRTVVLFRLVLAVPFVTLLRPLLSRAVLCDVPVPRGVLSSWSVSPSLCCHCSLGAMSGNLCTILGTERHSVLVCICTCP